MFFKIVIKNHIKHINNYLSLKFSPSILLYEARTVRMQFYLQYKSVLIKVSQILAGTLFRLDGSKTDTFLCAQSLLIWVETTKKRERHCSREKEQ